MDWIKTLSWIVVTTTATLAGADDWLAGNRAILEASISPTAAAIGAPIAPEPFAASSWTMQAYGSATFGDDASELYLAHMGFGYHIWDNFSFNVELVGGGFHADNEGGESGHSAAAVGVDLLARYHFYRGEGWSLYGDAGSGFMQGTTSVPANGTHFNFTPQAGIGLLMNRDHNMDLITGARWHHISNARMNGIKQNPGYDGAMIYAGMLFRF